MDANPSCTQGDKVALQDPGVGEVVEPGTNVTLYHGAEPEPTGPTATGPTE